MSNYSDPITATGSLITFDAPFGGVFDSLSVPITPTQDLHGYANPWPAGGGKNKIDKSTGLVYSTRYMVFGVANSSDTIPDGSFVLPAGEYTFSLSGDNSTNAESMSVFGADGTRIKIVYNNKILTFTNPSSQALKLSITISSGNFQTWDNYDMQMESGSTATAWEPYSNICPISGLTGLSVYVSPTQDQDDATVYNVDWTTKAGTVYGGTLDVVTGLLTVDRAKLIFDGSSDEFWVNWAGWYAVVGVVTGENYRVDEPLQSNSFRYVGVHSSAPNQDIGSFLINSNNVPNKIWNRNISFKFDNAANVANWKTYLASNPIEVTYPLATPLTYQLTPTQIAELVGSNNVWVDTSAVITLIYRLLQVDRQIDRTSIGKRAESLDVLGKFSSISKVEVNVTENLFYEAGDSSGRTLTVDCPFGTQEMADNLLAMLVGFYYQPYEARKAILDPAFEIGDGVTVGNVYGGIFSIHQKCGPLHLADLSAPADEEIDHEYKFTPAAERKIERRLNNMESELSVQAGEISAKVDRQGGDPSSVSWLMDPDVFKVAVDGSDVLTVDENGLTVNGDGNFTGNVQAKNIRYGGSNGTFSGGGISGGSIGTSKFASGINVSLGNADFSADVFSGAATATYTKAKNLYCVGRFMYNGTEFSPAVYYLLDQNNNVVRLRVLQS